MGLKYFEQNSKMKPKTFQNIIQNIPKSSPKGAKGAEKIENTIDPAKKCAALNPVASLKEKVAYLAPRWSPKSNPYQLNIDAKSI